MTQTFAMLGLRDELLRAIEESGYTAPSPIQEQAIPHILAGKDVIGQAQTGTGKTAAFGLPMLSMMRSGSNHIKALVLAPTRELATQVSDALFKYGRFMGARVLPIYGGQPYSRQHRRLEKGCDVVVATPGRFIDLMNQGVLNLSQVSYLVLDEADEMLKMGFIDDVKTILSSLPKNRQTVLFSATMPKEIRDIATQFMNNPTHVAIQREAMTVQQIEQRHYLVHPDSKIPALSRLLETEDMQSALIFTRTRADSAALAEALLKRGYMTDSISGDLSQDAREAVLHRFRNGDLPILVATDVVARGVDIPQVSHVFNFDIPQHDEDYVHRIGRTGRAGRSGVAITMVTPREVRRLQMLERFIKQPITRTQLPKLEDIRIRRDANFAKKLEEMMQSGESDLGMPMLEHFANKGYTLENIAIAALQLARLDEIESPIDQVKTVYEEEPRQNRQRNDRDRGNKSNSTGTSGKPSVGSSDTNNEAHRRHFDDYRVKANASRDPRSHEAGMVRLVMNVGKNDNVRPGDVVGTIASSSGIEGKSIGAIRIHDSETFFDVPESSVDQVLKSMKRGRLRGKAVRVTRMNS